jgi:hypothetical protein
MRVLFSVEHPEPSDDGATIGMDNKPTPDGDLSGDGLGDDSNDSVSLGEDLFGGESLSGGGFSGGGLDFDSDEIDDDTESSIPSNGGLESAVSPEEQYVQTNYETYKQLTDDIYKIIEDIFVKNKKITEKDSRYVIKKLRDYQWSNNALLELSSLGSAKKDGNLRNLDNLIKDIINDKIKNLSLKNYELSTL